MTQSPVDICMFVHNDVTHDSRVRKEAASLAAHGWRVVVVGVSLSGKELSEREVISGFTVVRVTPRLLRDTAHGTFGKLLRLAAALPMIIVYLRRERAQVYHGHDFVGLLVLALAGIWRRPIVYDSHELFFDRYPKGLFNYPLKYLIWLMRPLERFLARRATAIVTVSDGLADILAKKFNVVQPTVIRNAVDIRDSAMSVPIQRLDGQALLAHTGNLANGRHLLELVSSLSHLPANISVLLIGEGSLKDTLIDRAQSLGVEGRLLFMPSVPPEAVSPTLSQADAAAVLTTPNYEIALPNKFFEAVAAGVPVIGTRLPEVARLVNQYELGEICDPFNPESIAEAVRTVLQPENLSRFRQNVLKARALLNWEVEEEKLVTLYSNILSAL